LIWRMLREQLGRFAVGIFAVGFTRLPDQNGRPRLPESLGRAR
jgi:hypothetical protein